jgi:uncharacterized protein YdeI (YjbR/CyaY-like superfamily)
MASRDSRIDQYIAKAQPFARPVLKHLRKIVHTGCPGVEETMKWSFPHFQYKGMLCSMASFKEHCVFGFWNQSIIGEDQKSADAMGQFGRLTSIDDLPAEKTLITLVKKAAALNDAGIKPKRPAKTPKQRLEAPDYMMAAIRKNKQAQATFEGFPPSQQREYVEWVVEAKAEDTRERRLKTAVEWMAEGKVRNWKYMAR